MQDPRFRVAAARRILHHEGCDGGIAGQVSVRAAEDDGFWVSPFGFLEETVPGDVQKLAYDCTLLPGGDMSKPASPAVDFHAEIYMQRSDVQAVVHTHSLWASMLCGTTGYMAAYNVDSILLQGQQAEFAPSEGESPIDPKLTAAALGDKRILLMRHHGITIAGRSLEEAVILARDVELMARFELQLMQASPQALPEYRLQGSRITMETLHVDQLWAANMRRLRRTDPELFEFLIDEEMRAQNYM